MKIEILKGNEASDHVMRGIIIPETKEDVDALEPITRGGFAEKVPGKVAIKVVLVNEAWLKTIK